MALKNRAGLAMSASSRPGQDVSCGNEALDIAQVPSRPQAQHTSLETLVEHVRLPSLSPKQAKWIGDIEAKLRETRQ
jgi:hypothetical protein